MSLEQLERIKAKRAGHRGIVMKLTKEMAPLFLEGSERALNRMRTINRQLEDKLMLLHNLDGEILELFPVSEVEDEIMEADVISSKIIDLQEQTPDFMAKSRVSDKSTKLPTDPIVDKAMEPAKSPVRTKTVDLCSKTADVSVHTDADFDTYGNEAQTSKIAHK